MAYYSPTQVILIPKRKFRMKKIYTLIALIVSITSQSQISIQSAHLPNAGDTLITRNANFLSDFDPETTGENYVWDVSFDLLQPMNLNAGIACVDVDDTPIAYQFMFNNPFDPDHNSDFAYGVDQAAVGGISFEDAYQYFKNSGNVYSMTGMGASINGVPLAAQMNDPDVIYNLPLTYTTSGSSNSEMQFDIPTIGFYGLSQTREYVCDGWGTLNIWDLTFEVVRVRSVVNATDSVYTELFGGGIGFSFPRPETITYEWISTSYNVPVLKVVSTGGFVTQVQTADIYNDPNGVVELSTTSLEIFPNPAADVCRISGLKQQAHLSIFDSTGKLFKQIVSYHGENIDVSSWQAGQYQIVVRCGNDFSTLTLLR